MGEKESIYKKHKKRANEELKKLKDKLISEDQSKNFEKVVQNLLIRML